MASPIWVGVASLSEGATRPGAMPPWPMIWWQPEQLSVNSWRPSARSPRAGSTAGIGGPPGAPPGGAARRDGRPAGAAAGRDVGDQRVDVAAAELRVGAHRLDARARQRHAAR